MPEGKKITITDMWEAVVSGLKADFMRITDSSEATTVEPGTDAPAGGRQGPNFSLRPRWDDVFEGYPKIIRGGSYDDQPARDVFTYVLGADYDRNKYDNACATRVSLGLINGGVDITHVSFYVQEGELKGKAIIGNARVLKNWLVKVWGAPDEKIAYYQGRGLDPVAQTIKDRNGIYIILGGFGGGVTGHATLWIGSQGDVIGGHNYATFEGTIYFWELR